MTSSITHHPTDEALAAWAAGSLDRPRSLVVAMHLARCPSCSRQIGLFEAVGGSLLEAAPATSLGPKALEEALRRVDQGGAPEPAAAADPLSRYELGAWRWVGPGVYRRSVSVREVDGIRVFMLKAAPLT